MRNALILAGLTLVAALHTQAAVGQAITVKTNSPAETLTITEPAKIKLGQLFKMADVVAVVRIVSGDTESYKFAIYKAVVVKSMKGAQEGKTIYFGPYSGVRLGWEYVVFLRKAKDQAVPTKSPTAAYGTVEYLEDFNQGYAALESTYSCVFDGKIPERSCDYGVRVCTDYIVLPQDVRAFPPEKDDPPFGCRWVRKSRFMELLGELSEQPGVLQAP